MRKVLIVLLLFFFIGFNVFPQGNIGIGDTNTMPDSSAMLDISSTTGGLLMPRMTETQRNAISDPSQSLLVYQTDQDSGFYYYDGNAWIPFLTNTSGSGGGWSTTGNTGTTAGTHFIGTTDATDWVVKTNNAEVMRITSGGQLGIGLTAPQTGFKLDVNGAIVNRHNTLAHGINPSAPTGGQVWQSVVNSGDGSYNLGYRSDNTPTTGSNSVSALVVHRDATSGSLVMRGGNVGVGGLPSPAATLDVLGNVKIVDGTQDTAKVLTSDANGNASWKIPGLFVEAYLTNTVTLTCNAFTKITYNMEQSDDCNLYNPTNGRLTPTSGIWKINMSIHANSGTGETNQAFYALIYKNGSIYKRGPISRNFTSYSTGVKISTTVEANGTDYFEFYLLYGNCTVASTITGSSQNVWMQAAKLSD